MTRSTTLFSIFVIGLAMMLGSAHAYSYSDPPTSANFVPKWGHNFPTGFDYPLGIEVSPDEVCSGTSGRFNGWWFYQYNQPQCATFLKLWNAERYDAYAQVDVLNGQVWTLTASNNQLTTDKALLTTQVWTLTASNNQLTTDKALLTTQVSTLTVSNNQLTTDKALLTTQVSTLTVSNNQLTTDKALLTTQVSTLTASNNQLTTDNDILTNTVANRDAKITILTAQITANIYTPTLTYNETLFLREVSKAIATAITRKYNTSDCDIIATVKSDIGVPFTNAEKYWSCLNGTQCPDSNFLISFENTVRGLFPVSDGVTFLRAVSMSLATAVVYPTHPLNVIKTIDPTDISITFDDARAYYNMVKCITSNECSVDCFVVTFETKVLNAFLNV
jgi:FtsZ-binding cell division protein ZapB